MHARAHAPRAPGNHAFIGLAFNKREDAFDLKSCLADVEKAAVAQEKGVDLGLGDVSSDLLAGFSAGQKISLSVGKKAAGGGGGGGGAGAPAAAPGGLRPLGKLAPPGSSSSSSAGAGAGAAAAAAAGGSGGNGGGGGSGFDLLGMGGAQQQQQQPAAAAPPAAPAPAAQEWETF
jgi:hypothetical protein